MATRTRYKSSSPAPIAAPILSAANIPHSPQPSAQLTSTLSSNMFPTLPRTEPASQRRSDLPILNYHNSRPSGETSIVLPPASALLAERGPSHVERPHMPTHVLAERPHMLAERGPGHVLGQEPARGVFGFPHPPPPTVEVEARRGVPKDQYPLPFGYHHARGPEPPARSSLSIQSLISPQPAPPAPQTVDQVERGMKRKGSEIMDRDGDDARSSRDTSVVSTSTSGVSMEDPDVRDAVEALGGLKAGMSCRPCVPIVADPA